MSFLLGNWITIHSLFSLKWDEWGSIVAVLTAIVLIIRWAISRSRKQIFGPIDNTLREVKKSIDKQCNRIDRSESRLEKEERLSIRHEEELKDHERRITNLEEHI